MGIMFPECPVKVKKVKAGLSKVSYAEAVKIVEEVSRDDDAMAVEAQQSVAVSQLRDPETLIVKKVDLAVYCAGDSL